MEGTLTAKELTWKSAQNATGGLVPAVWDVPLSLPAADKVVPGGPDSIAEKTIILNGPGGFASVPLSIIGMSYRLSSSIGVEIAPGSTGTTVSGVSAIVRGAGPGNQMVTLSSLSSPFTHYRPVLKAINTSDWLAAFKVKGLESGRYQGSINYQVPYNYYRNNVLIRNTLRATLTVTLEYNSTLLQSVAVTGGGVITPQYYGYPERLVGGSTDYLVTATGVSLVGVFIRLKTQSGSNEYQLLSQATDAPQTGINFSVQCTSGCSGASKLINEGRPTNNSIKMLTPSHASGQATITVSFSNKKLDDLNNDTYRGSFVLIFEAGV
jgi:hypothetical protein